MSISSLLKKTFILKLLQNNYLTMSRALKVFFTFISLVLSIQAVVTASTDVDQVEESSVTVPEVKLPFTITSPAAGLKGPVVLASQPSTVSANLRKKEENDVELEGVTHIVILSNGYDFICFVSIRCLHSITI
jgi:hypothetical protein